MASSYPTMLIALRGGGTCSSSSIRSSIGSSKTTIMASVSSSTTTTLKRRRETTTTVCFTGGRSNSSSSSRLLSTMNDHNNNNLNNNTAPKSVQQRRRGVATCSSPSSSSSATSPIVTALVSPIKLAEFFDRQSAAASAASSLLSCSSSSSSSSASTTSSPSFSSVHPTGLDDMDPSLSHHHHPPTLLCMDIQRHQMSFAVVKHPQFHNRHHDDDGEQQQQQQRDQDILVVPSPIHTKERKILSSTIDTMWDIVQRYRVCGMIVHWPIEYDTGGKMGAKCGRTLYTLEKLQQESIVSSTDRPVCLFPHPKSKPRLNNNTTAGSATYIDEWGRCAGYGRTRPVMEDLIGPDSVEEEDIVGGDDEQQPIYYYHHALRNRYYDPIHMVSNNRPIHLWKEFRDQSWSSPHNMTLSSAEQRHTTMMVSGSGDGVVHKDVSDAKLVVDAKRSPRPNWTQPKPRRHRTKYHRKNNLFVKNKNTYFDDEMEDEMDDVQSIETHLTAGRSSSSSSSSSKTNKPPSKHLFVDRELRVAAAA